MPKILIDDFEESGCQQHHKHFFSKHTKIYPIDYIYCKEYIKTNIYKHDDTDKNSNMSYSVIKWIVFESSLVFFIKNNMFDDIFVEIFIFSSIHLFICMLYMIVYDKTPFGLDEFGYHHHPSNTTTTTVKYGHCYSCGVLINFEGAESIENMCDYEVIYLSCGHLHHTMCLTSDFIQKTTNTQSCNYCNTERSLNVLKPIIGDAYYASIMAYDFKNDDYINEIDETQYKILRRSDRIKNKSK